MPSFLTQCPHCLTSFRVTVAQLEAAEGLVRCGACLGIFSADANRITLKQTPGEAAQAQDEAEPGEEPAEAAAGEVPFAAEDPEGELEALDAEEEGYAEHADHDDLAEPGSALAQLEHSIEDFPLTATKDARADEDEEAADQDDAADSDLLDAEDFDIPLGDLNLDGDYAEDAAEEDEDEFEDEEELEEEDESDYEEELDDEDEFEEDEFDDEDSAAPAAEVYEEYEDEEPAEVARADFEDSAPQQEEFEPDIEFADDDEAFIAETNEALAAPDDGELEFDEDAADEEEEADDEADAEEEITGVPGIPPRFGTERLTTDKSELRRYLADIEDDESLGTIDDDAALDALAEPVMLDSAPRRSWLAGFALFLGVVALSGALLLQLAAANIERVSRSSAFAALLPYLCSVLECPAPERSQLELLVTEQLLVRSHPRFAEALEVSLVFRNDAPVAQPFPALELAFSDSSNRLLANRLFAPAEYLPVELRTSEMPAQSSLQVMLELVDPGSDAVNYTLVFREP